MYAGDPEGDGISAYEMHEYRDEFNEVDFIPTERLLSNLSNTLKTEDYDLLDEADNTRFKIPEYQRYYSWEDDQHQDLLEELLQILNLSERSRGTPPENFFGTIYIGEMSQRAKYEIIDGQQRLTTMSIILEVIRRKLSERLEDVSGDLGELAEHVEEGWLEEALIRRDGPQKVSFIESSEHDNEIYQILFKGDEEDKLEGILDLETHDGRKSNSKRVSEILDVCNIPEEIIENYDVDEDTLENEFKYFAESHELLANAFDFYDENVQELLESDFVESTEHEAHLLINLAFFCLRSFRIAEILFEGDNRELRVNVFQELNDRGKDLSTMDKIRARVVSRFLDEGSRYSLEDELDVWENIVERFGAESNDVEEFIAYYIAATKNPEEIGEARENKLDLFRLNKVGDPEIEPEFLEEGQAHEFLQELQEYSKRYAEILDGELVGGTNPLDENERKTAEEVLKRLDGLGTTQWIPLVLYLYHDITSIPGKDDFFVDVLKTVENVVFRVSLTDLVSTVVDDTFIKAAEDFRRYKENNDPSYDSEDLSEIILNRVPDNRALKGDTFARNLIQDSGWGNNQVRQLYMKIVDEEFEEDDEGMTRRSIEDNDVTIDIEHVFPRGYIRDDSVENEYAWLEDFFYESGDFRSSDLASESEYDMFEEYPLFEQIDMLIDEDASSITESNPMYDRIKSIEEQIRSLFVNDIGNMMVLVGELNRSIKNSRLSVKMQAYHENHPEDLGNSVNEFFSTTNPDLEESDIVELCAIEFGEGYDDTEPDYDIEKFFNGWWNLERLIERKVQVTQIILESIEFSVTVEEFNYSDDDIREWVEEDMVTRMKQPA